VPLLDANGIPNKPIPLAGLIGAHTHKVRQNTGLPQQNVFSPKKRPRCFFCFPPGPRAGLGRAHVGGDWAGLDAKTRILVQKNRHKQFKGGFASNARFFYLVARPCARCGALKLGDPHTQGCFGALLGPAYRMVRASFPCTATTCQPKVF
jgi:hypothetical protein